MMMVRGSRLNDLKQLMDRYTRLKEFFNNLGNCKKGILIEVKASNSASSFLESIIRDYNSVFKDEMLDAFIYNLKNQMQHLEEKIRESGIDPDM